MLIKNLIVHKIYSNQYEPDVIIQARKKENSLPNPDADNLLTSVEVSFGKDRNIAYAGFDESKWFPLNLKKVLAGKLNFLDFTINGLDILKDFMTMVPPATGGYLSLINYEDDSGIPFFMAILLKDRDGIGINDMLDLEPIQSLELDKLHFAARINIMRWLSKEPSQNINHITFLKGANRENVVKYFQQYLGINEGLYSDPQKNNKDLVNSVLSYTHIEYNLDEAKNAIRRVHDLANQKDQANESITLSEISNIVNPKDPDHFVTYLHDQEIEIPGEFPVVMGTINKLDKFKFQTKDLYLSFHRNAIDDELLWINNDGNLEIKNVPEKIKREFPSYQ